MGFWFPEQRFDSSRINYNFNIMKLIIKLVHIDFLNSEGNEDCFIGFIKMPDHNNGKDDLSLQDCDKAVLKKAMNKNCKFIDAHVICTEYSNRLIPDYVEELYK